MKIIKANLEKDFKEIRIIPISDVHIGDKLCDIKLFKEILHQIETTPNMYTIINGDMCNTALKMSKSDVYSDEMSSMEQVKLLIELLEPIKDKILVLCSGNHEERVLRETSIDPMYFVAKELGIEDKYTNGWWYLFLRFGQKQKGRKIPMCYQITGYHGAGGGGRKPGGKINRVTEMSQVVVADLYIMGHVHEEIATKGSIFLPDYGNNTLNKKEMNYIVTNSFLKYGGYGERLGFTPKTNSQAEAVLSGTERNIKIIL